MLVLKTKFNTFVMWLKLIACKKYSTLGSIISIRSHYWANYHLLLLIKLSYFLNKVIRHTVQYIFKHTIKLTTEQNKQFFFQNITIYFNLYLTYLEYRFKFEVLNWTKIVLNLFENKETNIKH